MPNQVDPSVTTEQEREEFARLGATCIRSALDPFWLDAVAHGVDRVLADPSPTASFADPATQRFFQDANNWPRIMEFEFVMRYSPLRQVAAELLGASKINLLQDHVLVKEAGADKRTLWHQDQPYSPIDGFQFCTIWFPVDPVPRETALEFIAGSHQWGKWFRPQQFVDGAVRPDDDDRWEVLPPDIECAPEVEVVGWALEPGDCLAFYGVTLHGAPGNPSTTRRRVFSSRWTGDDARIQRRSGKMSPPLASDAPADGKILDSRQFPVVWRRQDVFASAH